jgi:cytochrome c oxidase subunit 2
VGRGPHRFVLASVVGALLLALAGCGGRQSTLAPDSHASKSIDTLWWIMLVGATIVFAVVVLLLAAALLRARGSIAVHRDASQRATRLVVIAGGVVPLAILVALFVLVLRTIPATSAPHGHAALTIHVTARQWFWDVAYDGTKARTANEIHIPVGEDVKVVATTDDVIHSLWVPALNRKIDTIHGQENAVLFRADKPGTFRGTCAEFCGLQHAKMGLLVIAEPRARFQAWLRREARPAQHELALFQQLGCGGCHTIRGTSADGRIGPDLTHLASRRTLAAATLANTGDDLGSWIADPQHFKPGNRMPAVAMTGPQLERLLAYLEALR